MAVYTQLTNEQITNLLSSSYAVGELVFAVGIAQGVENTNYLVVTTEKSGDETKLILTLYEKRVNTDELPFFLELMQYASAHGLSCPQPILRRDGTLFGECEGKQAALVSFVQGKSRSILHNQHVASVGWALAELHHATQGFARTRANALALDGWHAVHRRMAGRLDEIQPGLEALVVNELGYLGSQWPAFSGLPRGIIHADLFPDNVFFEGDDVSGIIDFYFACHDMLAYDIAITINAWCFERGGEFNLTKAKLLLSNYQKKRALSANELSALPILLRGAALRFLLTRAHDWLHHDANAFVTAKDPLEYAVKLKFFQSNTSW